MFGFSVLPAGNYNGSNFNNAGNNGNFWSSTENSSNNAYNMNFNYNNANVNENITHEASEAAKLVWTFPSR